MSTHSIRELRNSEDWISQADAARIRRVTRQAISRLIKRGRLDVLKIGGKILLNRSQVESFKPEQAGRRAK